MRHAVRTLTAALALLALAPGLAGGELILGFVPLRGQPNEQVPQDGMACETATPHTGLDNEALILALAACMRTRGYAVWRADFEPRRGQGLVERMLDNEACAAEGVRTAPEAEAQAQVWAACMEARGYAVRITPLSPEI